MALNREPEIAVEIRVRGTVQGVGFRPTIYRLAIALQLRGEVYNDDRGVLIRVAGTAAAIERLIAQIWSESPPLARITEIISRPIVVQDLPLSEFIIRPSPSNFRVDVERTEIAADAATCAECRAEIFDPASRWYRYPFTNCTHCGPRLTILRGLPYDRVRTSMTAFPMCGECQREYLDPVNRRFHAQPIACPSCGPRIWLEGSEGEFITEPTAVISVAKELILQGQIIAIKGLGGFHLICDATNETVVHTLRSRKQRHDKPLAVMMRDVATISQHCILSAEAIACLTSTAAPIVLLPRQQPNQRRGNSSIAPSVTPGLNKLGVMLPYTPLHHLLFQDIDRPLVFTSGNLADEPQCIDLPSARAKLGTIADYLLMHDREIVNRLDDSVVQIVERQPQILRRARGYAPTPISLPPGCDRWPSILAMGSELKNTFCLVRSGQAILSPHLGDLESAAPNYERTLNWYLNLFDHHPTAIAVDLHPEYLSTKLGQALAIANDLPIYPIQHHHAHIAACMVENQIPADTTPLLGIALDGLGYGEDGTIWGGEFLLADYRSFQRVAKFPSIAMLGGTQAIYQPWRNTYAHLIATFGWEELRLNYGDLELVSFLTDQPRSLLDRMLTTGINSPLASSAGRLFDAVAAALGICRSHCSYEGQGAITLESMATEFLAAKSGQQSAEKNAYPCPIKRPPGEPLTLGFRPLWQSLLQDLQQGLSQPEIAARFHLGLAHAIVNLTLELRQQYPCDRVALTGGVFQNALLQQQVKQHLSRSGFTVLTHHLVPSNDGGLSLGQGTIAAVRVGLLG